MYSAAYSATVILYYLHTTELYVPERSILLLMARKNKKREAGSGSITKRKDGRWQGQYVSGYNPETGKPRRHTIYGQTQKEVAEKLRAATSSIDNGTFQEPRKITVKERIGSATAYAEQFSQITGG